MNDVGLRISWIVQGVSGSRAEGYRSALASNRYRAILPAAALDELGHRVDFVEAARWQFKRGTADVVILGKLLAGASADEFKRLSEHVCANASEARALGIPVVADFNDDHFNHPVLGPHWRSVARLASLAVTGSAAMANVVRPYTNAPITVIGDPLGSPKGIPRVFSRPGGMRAALHSLIPGGGPSRLKLAWYGNTVNWPPLRSWLPAVAQVALQQPVLLWMVTNVSDALRREVEQFNATHGPQVLAELIQWDEQTQWEVVRDADVVLIPSDPADSKKIVKTANRLTDALHAGRYVIASPLPAYAPFATFATLTDDPRSALEDYLRHPAAALEKVQQGQVAALMACGHSVVGDQWHAVLLNARSGPVPEPKITEPESTAEPVRLNLGCGDKILPGYVNVDVVPSRAGRKPDVICDLHDLSVFEDESADEILSVHVIEHFWRWEVEDILREWMRVLKPGAPIILECPNLLSACEELLRNPESGSSAGQQGQRSMWVFYGDPSWKDPYMIHRWGYTPHSLGELLRAVGFINVRQEPAQYKLREPRDMRIVAERPPR